MRQAHRWVAVSGDTVTGLRRNDDSSGNVAVVAVAATFRGPGPSWTFQGPLGIPRELQRTLKGPSRDLQGRTRDPQGASRDPQGSPRTLQGAPRDAPRDLQGCPMDPAGLPRTPLDNLIKYASGTQPLLVGHRVGLGKPRTQENHYWIPQ